MYFNADETATDPAVAITRLWGRSKLEDAYEPITTYNNGHPLIVLNQFMYVWASEDYCYYATQYSNITTAKTLIGRINNPMVPKIMQPMTCSDSPPTTSSVWTVPDVTVLVEGMLMEYANENGDPIGFIVPTNIQRDPEINGGKGGTFNFTASPTGRYTNRFTESNYLLMSEVYEWINQNPGQPDVYMPTGMDITRYQAASTDQLQSHLRSYLYFDNTLPRYEDAVLKHITMPVTFHVHASLRNRLSPNDSSSGSSIDLRNYAFHHLNTPELQIIASSTLVPPGAMLVRKPTSIDKTTYSVGSATETSITVPGATWTPNVFQGKLLYISTGMGANQARKIISNTNNTIVVSQPFETLPNTTSVYQICDAVYRAITDWVSSSYKLIIREEPL
jgi:hypothetical protein